MAREALKTLFYPFESGALDVPGALDRALFLGAEPGFRLPDDFTAQLTLVQGFRPDYLSLQRQGFTVLPEPGGENFDLALVLCGRHRGENEVRLAEAILRVKAGGLIIVAGAKTDGIAALKKRLEKKNDRLEEAIAGRAPLPLVVETGDGTEIPRQDQLYRPPTEPVPLGGHLSKNHAVVIWLGRAAEAEAFAGVTRDWYGNWPLIERRFRTAPGMFSFDRIDAGSSLLVEHLPERITGTVADFCAGWGYLSAELAGRYPAVTALDLYEADFASLEAAKRNLAFVSTPLEPKFFWHDLLGEKVERRYDTIVMNPPFHQARAAEPELGQGMIRAAAGALKGGGRLFMVANRQLPYEKILGELFSTHAELARDGMFKVLTARR